MSRGVPDGAGPAERDGDGPTGASDGVALSVVVLSYNTREETLACLASVVEHAPAGTELVVVDNGSSDGSLAAFRAAFPAALVVDAGRNLGFAAGVNLGVAASSGRHVLLLNPDTLVLPGSIAALHAFALAHPERGVYGGRTLRADGSLDPSSCWGEMTLWSLLCFATTATTLARRSPIFDPESLGRWERDTVREVPVVTGCLLLTTRAIWRELGGMDETYFLYGEDADFSRVARDRGLRPTIVPTAEIIHLVGGSTASSGRKMCMVMAGKATYLRRRWARPRALVGLGLLQAGAGVRALGEAARRRRAGSGAADSGAGGDAGGVGAGGVGADEAAEGTWTQVWRRRADWRSGYPRARRTIFGLPEA